MFRYKSRLFAFVAVIATLMLAGCASGPTIIANQDPAANFGNYQTFGFEKNLETDKSGYSSLTTQYLKTATARELEARGYKQSADPDLIVNFYIASKDKIRTTQTPTTGGYYGYRGYGAWGGYAGYETQVTQYTEGTLNVDLVDTKKSQLVWEGIVVGKITDEVRKNMQSTVDQAIAGVFKKYPYVAGSNTPQTGSK